MEKWVRGPRETASFLILVSSSSPFPPFPPGGLTPPTSSLHRPGLPFPDDERSRVWYDWGGNEDDDGDESRDQRRR